MKFLCLAYEDERLFHGMPEQEWLHLRQQTLDYVNDLRKQGCLIDTQPLRSARHASTVQIRHGKLAITDGPFAETKEQLGGYFLIEAASFDIALRIAAGWPSATLGTIEVRPIDDGLSTAQRYD